MKGKTSATDLQLKIAIEIAKLIIDENLAVGSQLKESVLCAKFNVSRSPIRGALKVLAAKNVVSSLANHGFFLDIKGSDLSLDALDLGAQQTPATFDQIILDRLKGSLHDVESEADLMRRYNIPRRQLARALNRLSAEGIIERSAGYGWRFLPMLDSEGANDESYAFRILIEPAGLLEKTFKLEKDRLERCRRRHEQLIVDADNSPTAAEMFDINSEFHDMLAEFSGNRFYFEAVQKQNRLRRLMEYRGFVAPDRIRTSCQEHLEIMSALEKHNNKGAAKLLKKHLSLASKLKLAIDT